MVEEIIHVCDFDVFSEEEADDDEFHVSYSGKVQKEVKLIVAKAKKVGNLTVTNVDS